MDEKDLLTDEISFILDRNWLFWGKEFSYYTLNQAIIPLF